MKNSCSDLSLIIVGAGRAGTALAVKFRVAGATVLALTCKSPAGLERASEFVAAGEALTFNSADQDTHLGLRGLCESLEPESIAPLVLFAVSDDSLREAVSSVSEFRSSWCGFKVIHISGGQGLDVLGEFSKKGAGCGVFHPCYSMFGEKRAGINDCGACYTFEGSAELSEVLRGFVGSINGHFVVLEGIDRKLYHAANVFAAGHLVTLLANAQKLLVAAGVRKDDTKKVLSSLVAGVQTGVQYAAADDKPLESFITGPFARDETKLIAEHAAAIQRIAPELKALYLEIGNLAKK